MCATLSQLHIDLNWADEQYMSTLLKLIREFNKMASKKERTKVGASNIKKFINDDKGGING